MHGQTSSGCWTLCLSRDLSASKACAFSVKLHSRWHLWNVLCLPSCQHPLNHRSLWKHGTTVSFPWTLTEEQLYMCQRTFSAPIMVLATVEYLEELNLGVLNYRPPKSSRIRSGKYEGVGIIILLLWLGRSKFPLFTLGRLQLQNSGIQSSATAY